jgi:hypothetical protein
MHYANTRELHSKEKLKMEIEKEKALCYMIQDECMKVFGGMM